MEVMADSGVAIVEKENGCLTPNNEDETYSWRYLANPIPAQVGKHLDFIDVADGNLFLGSSNLSSRYWSGTVWLFRNLDDAPDVTKCVTGVECEGTVTAGLFLSEKEVLVTEDSGTISVMEVRESPEQNLSHFATTGSSIEHDSSVLSLDLLKGRSRAVTGAMDGCVKVLDLKTMVGEHTYKPAHNSGVLSISAHQTDENVFLSCSQDGEVLLWDTRKPKPAKVISVHNPQQVPSCVAWNPSTADQLSVGYQTGSVSVCDIRQDEEHYLQVDVHTRPVFKLVFSETSPYLLASCADDNRVVVTDFSEEHAQVVYTDQRHNDFVRGLSWHTPTGQLYTCGWDKQVIRHQVLSMDVNGQ